MIKELSELSVNERKELAAKCGISPEYLHQISTGFRKAGPATALKIHDKTNGIISKEIIRPDIWQ